jgi:hypothetical protein
MLGPLMIPLSFGFLCQDLSLLYGGFAGMPAHESFIATRLDWLGFGLAWLFDTLSFNASQIFQWSTTPIYPTTVWSGGLLWAYCVVMDLIVLAGLINIVLLLRALVTKRPAFQGEDL